MSQNSSLVTSRPDTPSNPPVLPPVLSPQVSPARGSSDQMEDDSPRDGIDPNIPDASDWTSEQVYQYFARLFPKEAEVFRQQVCLSPILLSTKYINFNCCCLPCFVCSRISMVTLYY